MTIITAKYVDAPKPGKKMGWVKTETDQRFMYDPVKLSLTQGHRYEVATEDVEIGGKTYGKVTSATPVGSNGAAPAPAAAASDAAPWWMPFVSNTVAHAIEAGKIEDPEQIKQWAAAAKVAAMEIKAEKPTPATGSNDDGPPF